MSGAALVIEDLTVKVEGKGDQPPILDSVSLDIAPGEVLALVGESGSGKSMTALSIMSLLEDGLERDVTTLTVDGVDLTTTKAKELQRIRGGLVGMLFQQPRRMLDPTCTVGSQMAEPLRLHLGMSRAEASRRVIELLQDVGIDEPERRARAFPHQLSGGLAQRVMIAMALSTHPKLLIADEPTTALDATIELQVLRLIKQKQAQLGMSALFISHDMNVVSLVSDRVAVIYKGQLLELGTTEQIMEHPAHSYTELLIRCSKLTPDANGKLLEVSEDDTTRFWLEGAGSVVGGQTQQRSRTADGSFRLVEIEHDPGHFVRSWVPNAAPMAVAGAGR